jgi:protein TonB
VSVAATSHGRGPLGSGLALSALVHAVLLGTVVWWGMRPVPVRPPVYRVDLVGAPAGPRQAGVLSPRAQPEAATAAPAAAGAERPPAEKAMPTPKAPKPVASPTATPSTQRNRTAGSRTPSPTATKGAPPRAGSGAVGGKGADVANVRTDGIAFPDQGYLNNIVRQLALSWQPSRAAATRVAEVRFTIRRDGSVTAIEVVKPSGDRLYDIDAVGAVEAVGAARSFGPLPAVWKDDVLIVYFTFDYALRP